MVIFDVMFGDARVVCDVMFGDARVIFDVMFVMNNDLFYRFC